MGSDALAVGVACGISERSDPVLAIDLGTNGEIILAGRRRILASSTAPGPAFESVNISCGMMAAPGAIDAARLTECDRALDIAVHVIGGSPPLGISGSGLVSLVAALRRAGIVDETGAFVRSDAGRGDPLSSRLVDDPGGLRFVLSATGPDGPGGAALPLVALTQRDIRELQLAKGAIRAGAEILLQELGINAGEISRVFLAGAFGTHLDKDAAAAIGLLPPTPRARVTSVGNAAGEGAVLAITSGDAYREALRLARKIEHVELGAHARFQEIFAESMTLEAR